MKKLRNLRTSPEFGDFQTPGGLARRVVGLLGDGARAVVEPTCGRGTLLVAALERFAGARGLGLEIDGGYVAECRAALGAAGLEAEVRQADFFAVNWDAELARLPDPLLVVGNPPWVTSAAQGATGGANLPARSAAHVGPGLDAVTGASNFDISEWMMHRLATALAGRRATLAMLCKSSVARRLMRRLWRDGASPAAELFAIDAAADFGAAVSACLLVLDFARPGELSCAHYPALDRAAALARFGLRGGELVGDLAVYDRWCHLIGDGPRWRSGVKHDCAAVMELVADGDGWQNGLGDPVDLEPDVLFPLLKSSELAAGTAPRRRLLLPQRATGDDPAALRERAPRAWRYLERHGDRLDARKSAVYRHRPRFCVFGVGAYSFAPYKVAVSGFYRPPRFRLVGPVGGRPVLLDDTCYFLSFEDEAAAARAVALLESAPARELLAALTFAGAKRPVTARLLSRLSLEALTREAG